MSDCQHTPFHDLQINELHAHYFDNWREQTVQVNHSDDNILCLVGNRGQDERIRNFEAIRFGDYLESGDAEVKQQVKLSRDETRAMKRTGDYSIIVSNVTLSEDEQELLKWLIDGLKV